MEASNISHKRVFILGDEWLYLKIYCGNKIADDLLIHFIKPFSYFLLKENLINKWFFIRYADPDEHLRIRMQLTSLEELNRTIKKLNEGLKMYFDHNQIWKVEYSTYNRELERYGELNIENSESYFFFDSEFIIDNLIKYPEDTDRFLNVIKHVEKQISFFGFQDKEIIDFLNTMQIAFKEEFNANKHAIKAINNKYKELKENFDILNSNYVSKNYIKTKKIVKKILVLNNDDSLGVPLENLIASYIHMTVNRSFRTNQRLYEFMLYDFLFRSKKSKFSRYGKL